MTSYRPDIDGLRAFSILMVLIYHGFASLLPGGFIGVDVFFVISGFIITRQILSPIQHSRFSLMDFYLRRIKRLLPSLIAVLLFVCVVAYFYLSLRGYTQSLKHVMASSFFGSNFFLWKEHGYFDSQSTTKPLLHLWSLAIEEQFYLLWPVLLMGLAFLSKKSPSKLKISVTFVCLASFLYSIFEIHRNPVAAFYSPFSRFWEIGVGCLAAVVLHGRSAPKVKPSFGSTLPWDLATLTSLTALVFTGLWISKHSLFPGYWALIPTCAALLMIVAGERSALAQFLLCNQLMIGLGVISYSLYLWHWPVLTFLRIEFNKPTVTIILVGLAISVLLATLTHFYIERPTRTAGTKTMALGSIVALGFIGCFGWMGMTNRWIPTRLVPHTKIKEANVVPGLDLSKSKCTGHLPAENSIEEFCSVWGNPDSERSIFVWGDSMASAWMPLFASLAKLHDLKVFLVSHPACPPLINTKRVDKSIADKYCNDFSSRAEVVSLIETTKPMTVFLIARWNLYYHGHIKNDELVERSFITSAANDMTADRSTAAEAFVRQLPETLIQLRKVPKVVVFRDTPVLKVPIDIGLTHRPKDFEPRFQEHLEFEKEINGTIDKARKDIPNVIAFDPTKLLCNQEYCPAFIDEVPIYFDEVHLTAKATLKFYPEIERIIIE